MPLKDDDAPTGSANTSSGAVVPYYRAYPQRVQEGAAGGTYSKTLGMAPAQGNLIIAMGHDSTAIPTAAAGWASFGTHAREAAVDPYARLVWRLMGAAESATQTPFSGSPASGRGGVVMIEVANVDPAFVASYEAHAFGIDDSIGAVVADAVLVNGADRDLAIAFGGWWGTGGAQTLSLNAGWVYHASDSDAGASAEIVASVQIPTRNYVMDAQVSATGSEYGLLACIVILRPDPGRITYRPVDVKTMALLVQDPAGATALAVADGVGLFPIDATLSGKRLVDVSVRALTPSSSGAVQVMLRRWRGGTSLDMLSTPVTLDSGEYSSTTALTPFVIDAAAEDVITDDFVFVDIDAAGTGVLGLSVTTTYG